MRKVSRSAEWTDQQLYLDGCPEREYKREKEALLAALRSLGDPSNDEVLIQGDHVEGLVEAWHLATPEERREIVQTMLQAVYLDMPSAQVVALDVKPAFRPLFKVWLQNEEPEALGLRFGDIVYGDPEGIRTPDLHRDRVACLTATPRGRGAIAQSSYELTPCLSICRSAPRQASQVSTPSIGALPISVSNCS
jgi:hypothetical protein